MLIKIQQNENYAINVKEYINQNLIQNAIS